MAYEVKQMKPSDLDLSKIASSAGNAKSGNFVKVNETIFSQPGLEFKARDDGTIAIISGGIIIGFTVMDENTSVETPVEDNNAVHENADVRSMESDNVQTPPVSEEVPKQEEVIEKLEDDVPDAPVEPEVPNINVGTIGASGREASVDVPTQGQNGLTRDYTNYDYFFDKWTGGTKQREMADLWNSAGRQEDPEKGIAMYNGRYIVAMTETFGQVGDAVDVVLEDGTIVPCILGDIKSMSDPNCTPYGHKLGGGPVSCVEWETTRSMDDSDVLGSWNKQKVVQVINTGVTVI